MKRLTIFALAMAVSIGVVAAAQAQTKLRLLSSWSKSNNSIYAIIETYVRMVNEVGKGAIEIQVFSDEVVPAFQQLQPASAGIFDMLFTHGSYHLGSKGLTVVLDAIDYDPDKRRAAGVWQYIDNYYAKHHNLRLVSIAAPSRYGYHIFLKEPLTPEGDFKGRKIRGTQTYHGIIRLLGGSPVVLPPGEIYSALEKNVIDGAAWPAAGMLSMKHYEVAKYRLRPTFGTTNEPILVNLARWGKLTPAEQQILLDAGARLEKEMPDIGEAIQKTEDDELARLGVKDIRLSPDKVAGIERVWSESLWELAQQCCADGATELRQLALKAGMTK